MLANHRPEQNSVGAGELRILPMESRAVVDLRRVEGRMGQQAFRIGDDL
jgi:hypothetical protein